jgi:hypothetical protein
MRALEFVVVLFVATVFFLWAVVQPTAEERARVRDSIGHSTQINWR